MKQFMKVGIALASLVILAASASAQGGHSEWHGKISFNTSEIPNPNDPNQQQLVAYQVSAQQQTSMSLKLKCDNTYCMVTTVGSSQETTTGTWTLSGYQITITPLVAGQPGTARTFNVGRDGRSLKYVQGPLTVRFWR